MKKRLLVLLLAVCMIFGSAVTIHATYEAEMTHYTCRVEASVQFATAAISFLQVTSICDASVQIRPTASSLPWEPISPKIYN